MSLSNAAPSVTANRAAPRLLLRPSSFSLAPAFRPGFEWGVILQAVLTAFRLFGFSPCARPRAQANFRKPAEAGWEFAWGVILQAVLTAFRLFGFSPCARPRAQANFRKPAE